MKGTRERTGGGISLKEIISLCVGRLVPKSVWRLGFPPHLLPSIKQKGRDQMFGSDRTRVPLDRYQRDLISSWSTLGSPVSAPDDVVRENFSKKSEREENM